MKTIESTKPKTAFYWRIRHVFVKNELERLVKGKIEEFDIDPMLNLIKEIQSVDFQNASPEARAEVESIQETVRQIKSWLKLKVFW